MRITRSTFTRGVIEEGGRWFFQYKTIENDGVVSRKVELHKTQGNDYYLSDEGRKRLIADRQEEARWLTPARMAEELQVATDTVVGYKKGGSDIYSIRLPNGKRIDCPSVIIGRDRRIKADAIIEHLWLQKPELADMLGMTQMQLARCRCPGKNTYKIQFERGQTVELRYAQLPSGTRISPRRLEDARKWSEKELAAELEVKVTEVKKMADTERSVYVVMVGCRKIELPYRMKDGKPRIDVDNLIKATWPTLDVVTAELGVTQEYMERCRAAGEWEFRFVLNRGKKESTLGYTIVDGQIRINPKDWEVVRKKLAVAK
jgi:DNA-binding Xre family transcriptional regulator